MFLCCLVAEKLYILYNLVKSRATIMYLMTPYFIRHVILMTFNCFEHSINTPVLSNIFGKF